MYVVVVVLCDKINVWQVLYWRHKTSFLLINHLEERLFLFKLVCTMCNFDISTVAIYMITYYDHSNYIS